MTGAEKIAEIGQQLAEIKKNIQEKYDKVMGKVEEFQEKLKVIDTMVGQSKEWIDKQKKKIQKKIEELTTKIKTWLQTQFDKAQAWMDNIKNEITAFIAKLLTAPILALAGI